MLGRLRRKVDFPLALAAFFAGFPTDFAVERCEILKLSNKQIRHIEFLLAHRGRLLDSAMSLAQLKKLLAEPYFWDLYELERAIQKAAGVKAGAGRLGRLRRRIRDLGDIDVKPKPLLNGHDLMHLGAVPGPGLGQLAEELYVAQLEGDVQTREQAEQWVRAWLQRHPVSQAMITTCRSRLTAGGNLQSRAALGAFAEAAGIFRAGTLIFLPQVQANRMEWLRVLCRQGRCVPGSSVAGPKKSVCCGMTTG